MDLWWLICVAKLIASKDDLETQLWTSLWRQLQQGLTERSRPSLQWAGPSRSCSPDIRGQKGKQSCLLSFASCWWAGNRATISAHCLRSLLTRHSRFLASIGNGRGMNLKESLGFIKDLAATGFLACLVGCWTTHDLSAVSHSCVYVSVCLPLSVCVHIFQFYFSRKPCLVHDHVNCNHVYNKLSDVSSMEGEVCLSETMICKIAKHATCYVLAIVHLPLLGILAGQFPMASTEETFPPQETSF